MGIKNIMHRTLGTFIHPLLFISTYLVFLFMFDLLLLREYLSALHPLMLLWGLLIFLRTVIFTGFWKKIPLYKILLLVLLSMAISTVMNVNYGMEVPIKTVILSFFSYFVIFSLCIVIIEKYGVARLLKSVAPVLVVNFVVSGIGLWMSLAGIGGSIYTDQGRDFYGAAVERMGGGDIIINATGIMTDTNHAAVYTIVFIVLSIIYIRRLTSKTSTKIYMPIRLFLLANIILLVINLGLLNSRGSALAFAAAAVVTSLIYIPAKLKLKASRIYAVLIALVVGLGIGLLMYGFNLTVRSAVYTYTSPQDSVQKVFDYKNGSLTQRMLPQNITTEAPPASTPSTPPPPKEENVLIVKKDWGGELAGTGNGRTLIWGESLAVFATKPVFGVGTGNKLTYADKHDLDTTYSKRWSHAHNSYIDLLVEYGVVGFVLVALYVSTIVLKSVRRIHRAPYLEHALLLFCTLFVMTAALFLSMIYVGINFSMAVFMVLLALLSAQSSSSATYKQTSRRSA